MFDPIEGMRDVAEGELMAKRDGLLEELRRAGIGGVHGAGLTRTGGDEHLLLLVAPGHSERMPKSFGGTPITVRETDKAKA